MSDLICILRSIIAAPFLLIGVLCLVVGEWISGEPLI